MSRHNSLEGSDTPGRWNLRKTKVLYTASNPSLCAWEVFAHQIDGDSWPTDYFLLKIEVQGTDILTISARDLPAEWNTLAYKNSVRKFGSDIMARDKPLGFWVPSVVIPEEHNLILNPQFPNYHSLVKLKETIPFEYDERFKKFLK
ncbi:MAG: RES family NAD+ phosphorylase [Cytophagales bacterium]|nr:RES family NAD+ phosphorylase [Cytophagales bacterium]